MKYAYYPGCSGHGTSVEYETSTRAVCKALNMDLAEIDDWSCCGSTPAHSVSHELSGALSARNLMQAAKTGADAVVRGVRDSADLAWESRLHEANVRLAPGFETVWLPCDPALRWISSSLVRELLEHGRPVDALVPEAIAAEVAGKAKSVR